MDSDALFKIGYGLYVLTANVVVGADNGCIINTAQQVTDTPKRVSVTVNKKNYTHDMILSSGAFNLSVISQKASFELFQRFGFQSGREADKFSDFSSVERSDNGILYVTDSVNAYISGAVINTVDLETHTMFIADVTDAEVLDSTPTATYDYYHSSIKPKPDKQEFEKTARGWRCKICGYVYEREELPADFICPICKHGASDFEKI